MAAHRGVERHVIQHKPTWPRTRTIVGANGEKLRPDAPTPRGRDIELKPRSESGKALGKHQIENYQRQLGRKSRVKYYDFTKMQRLKMAYLNFRLKRIRKAQRQRSL
jgi:hypothetical protein